MISSSALTRVTVLLEKIIKRYGLENEHSVQICKLFEETPLSDMNIVIAQAEKILGIGK